MELPRFNPASLIVVQIRFTQQTAAFKLAKALWRRARYLLPVAGSRVRRATTGNQIVIIGF